MLYYILNSIISMIKYNLRVCHHRPCRCHQDYYYSFTHKDTQTHYSTDYHKP